ncbi:MAG: SH3 domain-containing protein [Christensenellales bacterium]|nr:SH3 domain-containing protein [Christensenellales bacterium]
MKRIWMSALLLLTALFAARAQAETVYDRGTMYGVMTVYEQPDSLSDVRMVYFSGTPVEVLESVEDGAGQVFTHVCVANQLEGYVLTRDSGENEVVLFSEGAADGPKGILPMLVANPGGRGIVNLRDRPSRRGRVLAEIPNGTTVEVMGVKEDDTHVLASWAHVRAGGQTGFMQLDLLTVPNTEAYWLAMVGTYMVLPMRSCSLNDVRPFDPPEITAEALAQELTEPKSREQVRRFFASLGMEITEEEAYYLETGEPFLTAPSKPEIQQIDADLSEGKALALVKTQLYSFLLETRADGKTVLLDMLTEFDAMRTERIGRTTWLVGRMGGPLDGGRGEYGCWYNLETRGADILYAEYTSESYLGGSLCTGTWASEDCLIYALTEKTQTEGESVAVTSQITIEGIRGVYTAEDIRRESVFEKTLCREYVYDASRGCLVIAGAQ